MIRLISAVEVISDFRAALPPNVCEHCATSIMVHCRVLFPSQPGADSSDLRDSHVRADRGSAAVAHCGSGLLLQEDF